MFAKTEIVDICQKLGKWSDIIALSTRQKVSHRKGKTMITKSGLDLVEIAELLNQWLTETAEKLNMDKDDLQTLIKQFLS